MRIINITDKNTASLALLRAFNQLKSIKFTSGMDSIESLFLINLIHEKAPKKVLEVGVATGSSSVVLLQALANTKNTKLYSIDYSTQLYQFHPSHAPKQHTTDLKTGYLMDNYPNLQKNWQLFTGGLSCNFMDEIGDGIDFCLIDTMHRLPGEVLDFLMVFPYLRDDATLILHDTNLQTVQGREVDISNNILISALSGTKLIQQENKEKHTLNLSFPNIAGVELKNQKDALWDIFNLLTLPWAYMPNDHDIELLRQTFQKHYKSYFARMFDDCIVYQKEHFRRQQGKTTRYIMCKECVNKAQSTM